MTHHTQPSPTLNFHSNYTSVVLYLNISFHFKIQKLCKSYHRSAQQLVLSFNPFLFLPHLQLQRNSICSIQKSGFVFGQSTGGSQGVNTCFHRKKNEEMDACRTQMLYLKRLIDKNLAKALPSIKNFISGKNMMG